MKCPKCSSVMIYKHKNCPNSQLICEKCGFIKRKNS